MRSASSSANSSALFSGAILPRYRKLARENLSAFFDGEMTPAEISRMNFRHFTALGANGMSRRKKPDRPSPAQPLPALRVLLANDTGRMRLANGFGIFRSRKSVTSPLQSEISSATAVLADFQQSR